MIINKKLILLSLNLTVNKFQSSENINIDNILKYLKENQGKMTGIMMTIEVGTTIIKGTKFMLEHIVYVCILTAIALFIIFFPNIKRKFFSEKEIPKNEENPEGDKENPEDKSNNEPKKD